MPDPIDTTKPAEVLQTLRQSKAEAHAADFHAHETSVAVPEPAKVEWSRRKPNPGLSWEVTVEQEEAARKAMATIKSHP